MGLARGVSEVGAVTRVHAYYIDAARLAEYRRGGQLRLFGGG